MTDDRRVVACRACGNRVTRDTRRCAACGATDPWQATAGEVDVASAKATAPRRLLAPLGILGLGILIGATGALLITAAPWALRARAPEPATPASVTPPATPATSSSSPEVPPSGAATATPPAVAEPTTAETPVERPALISRSRGRSEWMFFFREGDRIARMADEQLLGVVARIARAYRFTDGSVGPAYVVTTPEGREETFDADVLERSARVQ